MVQTLPANRKCFAFTRIRNLGGKREAHGTLSRIGSNRRHLIQLSLREKMNRNGRIDVTYVLNELSRALSHALRHEPWAYELEVDGEGWAPIDCVLAALRQDREEWAELSEADLAHMIEVSTKRRHEISNGRIRALYGHSIPGKLK